MNNLDGKFPETISVVHDKAKGEDLLAFRTLVPPPRAVDDEGSTVAQYQLVSVRKFRKDVVKGQSDLAPE